MAAYVITRLVFVGGPGAFPGAGTALTGPNPPAELKLVPGTGYDGQFVYRLALDPFTRSATAHGITFDSPAYRQQRIMTALLGRIVSMLPGITAGTALVIVNTLAVIVAVVAGVELVQDLGRHPLWGAVLALPAALPASLALDLTEPVAWAAVLLGLLAVRRRRWALMALAFTTALLARETAGVVVFGLVVESIMRIAKRDAAPRAPLKWLVVPVLVAACWQAWLWHVWGSLPLAHSLSNVDVGGAHHVSTARTATGGSHIPVFGIAKSFLYGSATGDTSNVVRGILYLGERLALLAVLGAAAWVIFSRAARPGVAVVAAWSISVLVALSLSSWSADVQFLRATLEAWGLSVLVLLHLRFRWTAVVLGIAGFTTGVVAISFVATV